MKDKYLDIGGAEDFYQTLLQNSPEWFKKFREESKEAARTIPIPTVKDEEWKYTSLALLTEQDYQLPKHHDFENKDQIWDVCDKDAIHFILVNGCFISSASNCEGVEGLKILHYQEAIDQGLLSEDHLRRSTPNDVEPFLSVNNTYHRCGAFIHVTKKFSSKKPIHLVHVNTSNEPYSVCPRNAIVMERSAEASVVESYVSFKDAQYFINAVTDVFMNENSKLHYSRTQQESKDAVHVGQTRVWQERDSHFDSFSLMMGAKLMRNNVSVISQGEGTDSIVDGLYLVDGKRHVDSHTMIDHQQPNCTSHQLYKGILRDESRAVFNGKIFVKQAAQQTNSYQLNKNLMMGAKARIDTKPQLEIFADDVKCSHGATIGQLNEEEIFYLQSRCISRNEAIAMLAGGFVQDVIDHIGSDLNRECVQRLLENN